MFDKLFNWLFGTKDKSEEQELAPWPFPVSDGISEPAPKVTRKPKAKKATTTKKKAPAKAKPKAKPKAKTAKTKKATTKKPSK
jgi:hypothetical protein